jgi:hypothetical protein
VIFFGILLLDRIVLFVTLTSYLIWFSRNKLIHDVVINSPSKVLHQILFTMDKHILAWNDKSLPSLWAPPLLGPIKENFDVVVRGSSVVATTTISNSSGLIIMAATQELFSSDVLLGEASTALLATWLAVLAGFDSFPLEGDALLVILAIKESYSFFFLELFKYCIRY